ncbi:NAD(P)-dependent oxidoreductase [Pararhodobacter sp. SW119]|uniref:NAD(P)-dependent oxidoreductase n=1 Tax=Pararhodobacter sp. SW119 TaxID=2780075 RepID=UPI0024733E47|nr:NAD(P)-dependent oxidoreductase [Pararhodobacter sp. SW119]
MTSDTVGLVGVGMMGAPMAANIARAGIDLVLCDADTDRAKRVAEEVGARAATDPAGVARQAGRIITMLPNSAVVEQVILGAGGLAEAAPSGTLLIEMSSGDPSVTRNLSERLEEKGVRIMDAPVSGGVPRAISGQLTIMAGGKAEDYAAAESLLSAMGTPTHVGILGAGQALKALNNLVSAGGFLIGIEALLIGQKFGLDPALMIDILNSSSGMNNSTRNKFKQYVLSRDFDAGGFSLSLMAKDVGIAMKVAESTGTPAPLSALCRELWATASKVLGPGVDHTAIARMSEYFAGAELASDSVPRKPAKAD